MKGPGGLQLGELGQSIAKAAKSVGDTTQVNQFGKVLKQQVTGNYQKQQSGTQQPKMSDALGSLGSMFEQNQAQQNPPQNNQSQQPQTTQQSIQEKFAPQQKQDQAELEAARRNIQQIEEDMKKIKEEREKNWEQVNQKEDEEKEEEEMWRKQEDKQKPVTAGKQEGGGKKG